MALEGSGRLVDFALSTSAGSAMLRLPAAAVPGAAGGVAAALALAPALPLLQLLQTWLDRALGSIEPAAAPTAAPAPVGTLAVALSGLPGATITLPAALLPYGRRAPPGLFENWPALQACCRLQRYESTALAEAALHEGAVLLLPGSFQPAAATLAPRLEPAGWPPLQAQRWQPATGTLELAGAAAAAPMPAAVADGWCVELEAPLAVPAGAWFGEAGVLHMGPAVPVLRLGSREVARGELVPLGQGWALRLTQVLQAAPA